MSRALSVARDYSEDVADTFRRLRRPLQRSMDGFRRRRVKTARFVGETWTRVRGKASAGCGFGFALQEDVFPGVVEPPEAIAYAFVRPARSALYEALVTARTSPARRLAKLGASLGFPYELRLGEEVAVIRHRPLAAVPPELFVLAASDFFVIALGPMRVANFQDRIRKATRGPG